MANAHCSPLHQLSLNLSLLRHLLKLLDSSPFSLLILKLSVVYSFSLCFEAFLKVAASAYDWLLVLYLICEVEKKRREDVSTMLLCCRRANCTIFALPDGSPASRRHAAA